jgi:hypothetical protein
MVVALAAGSSVVYATCSSNVSGANGMTVAITPSGIPTIYPGLYGSWLAVQPGGHLFVSTGLGIAELNNSAFEFTQFIAPISVFFLGQLAFDGGGTLWAVSGEGFERFTRH